MNKSEQEASNLMQNIAKEIDEKLPKDFGFTLLAYEFGDKPDRKMLYVSNSNREDVILAMLEFVEKQTRDSNIFGKDV